jgi:hypothetical protein
VVKYITYFPSAISSVGYLTSCVPSVLNLYFVSNATSESQASVIYTLPTLQALKFLSSFIFIILVWFTDLLHRPLTNGVNNGNVSPTQSSSSSLHLVPRVTVTDLHNPGQLAVTVSELPDMSIGIGGQHSPCTSFTPSPDGQFKKNVPEYSSFRIMKQKVSMLFREKTLSSISYCYIHMFFFVTWPGTCF